jgi:acetyl esterase/lipase
MSFEITLKPHNCNMKDMASTILVPVRPKVYCWWWHPHKTLIDILIGVFLTFLLPPFRYPKIAVKDAIATKHDSTHQVTLTQQHQQQQQDDTTATKDSEQQQKQRVKDAMIQHALLLRKNFNPLIENRLRTNRKGGFYQWSTIMRCDIVEVIVHVPRNDTILEQWKIIDASELSMIDTSRFPSNPNITLYVAFPICLLPHDIIISTRRNQFGCLMLECGDILTRLSKTIPLCVFFHSGGLTIGTPLASEYLDMVLTGATATSITTAHDDDDRNRILKPFIYVSVNYSLAPEYTFPLQPIEACTVISHLLDLQYKVHLNGVSAGAYLAIVAGLEAYRAHPNRSNIRSVFAACPMLTPTTDTLSFYENQVSSHFCPVHFLRWCYRSYLDLSINVPEGQASSISDTPGDDNDAILGRNSTRSDYYQSKWYQSANFRRLIEPTLGLPLSLRTDKNPPIFIITTNQADPLRDGSIQFVEALRTLDPSIVQHHDDSGSHWCGTTLDSKAYLKLAVASRDAIQWK